jgi:hypothetical protein
MMKPTTPRTLFGLLAARLFRSAKGETPGDSVKGVVLTDRSGVYSHATGKGVVLATQMGGLPQGALRRNEA